jgi:hypothetical protein
MPSDTYSKLKYFKEKVKSKKDEADMDDEDDTEDEKPAKNPKVAAVVIALDRKVKDKNAKRGKDY